MTSAVIQEVADDGDAVYESQPCDGYRIHR